MLKHPKFSAIGAAVLMAMAASAQAQEPAQIARVEVTGSSIKRVDSESALPVTVVTREEIRRSGVASTEALLASISSMASAGGLNTGAGAGSSTYGLSSVSLRGLGSDRTLVLVNGRRVAPFAGGGGTTVNVASIPLAAIERVEVLKDGASGVYGSDAVAGVINFILSKSTTGVELSATAGSPTAKGGGKNNRVSIVAGYGDLDKDRFNITASAGLEKETALFGRDREFSKTGNIDPYIVSGATGQGNIEGPYTPGKVVNGKWVEGTAGADFLGGSGYGNPLAQADKCADIGMFKNPTPNSTSKMPFCAYDSSPSVGLVPKRDLVTLSANLTVKLGEKAELFGDVLYSQSKVQQQFQPSPIRNGFLTSDEEFAKQGVDPVMLLRPNNPNYKIAADYLTKNGFGNLVGQALGVTARVYDFGDRTELSTADQSRLVLGVRGEFAGHDYELAATHNEGKTHGKVTNGYFSQVAFVKAVNAENSDYNPFSLTQSETFRKAIEGAKYNGDTTSFKSKVDVIDGKVSGELMALPAGPLLYAAGAQLRKESYVKSPSPAMFSGDIAGLGGATKPLDKSRTVKAVFAELNIPVIKTVEAGLALRHDNYNDAGSTTNYKVNVRFQPIKAVMLRGSAGTGFRAPTLVDLWDPQVLGTSAQFDDPGTGEKKIQVPSMTGGNPLLKPEKSTQSSFGIVVSPIKDMTLSADLFRVKMKDTLSLASVQEIVSGFRKGDASYANLVKLNPSGSIKQVDVIQSNTGSADVQGVDLEASYRLRFAGSSLDLAFNGTYMDKFDQMSPGGVMSHKVGTIVDKAGNPVLGADNGGVVLRWKHNLQATYTQGNWAGTLSQDYASGYEAGHDLNDKPNFMPSLALYNANISYTGFKNLRLTVGARNLFDKQPAVFTPASNQFQTGYDVSQYDPRGRFVYFTAGYKF